MRFSNDDLQAATDAGLITRAQFDGLLAFLDGRAFPEAPQPARNSRSEPDFDVVHLLWYTGALIVMTAMGLFTTLAFSQMGGWALLVIAMIYAAAFGFAGNYLWTTKGLHTPGGLLIAVAVSMAPLGVYGIQDALGLWSSFGKPGTVHDFYIWIKGSWIFMEMAALAAASMALAFYRFPFIVVIAAIALWFMSMDLVPWITGSSLKDWEVSRQVSIAFGLGMIVAAVIVNLRQRTGDFAFWLYLFGVLALWGGITAASDSTALAKAMYCAMNAGFLLTAIFLGRSVFAVFGTIGIAIYLGDLASNVFKDSLLFPFALSLIGVGIIAFGLYYYRHRDRIRIALERWVPEPLKALRPTNPSFPDGLRAPY